MSECSPDHVTPAGGENASGLTIVDSQDRDCLSLCYEDEGYYGTVHVCDWPALKAAVDAHQRERGGRT